jgi:N-acetylmuramoyl-L-alanine amidase/Secretion system C-terminal sorting domain
MKISIKFQLFAYLLFTAMQSIIAQKAESKNYTFLLQNKPSRTLSGGIKVEKLSDAQVFSILEIPIDLKNVPSFISFSIRLNGSNFNEDAVEVVYSEDKKNWKIIPHFHESKNEDPSVWVGELLYLDKNLSKIHLKISKKDKKVVLKKATIRFFNPGESNTTGDINLKTRGGVCPQPASRKRAEWGAALNLNENIYSGSPSFTTVTHIIVHHSDGSNTSSDWDAVVRAILDFHVNTNGWADVAYNWLIAPTGKLYVGRGGGNNVLGAHYCAKNGNTMGICLLGNYTNVAPTDTALKTLEKIIAWKCTDSNIDPLATANHAVGNLKTIEGHRSGCATDCPGNMTYALLDNIRTNVSKIVNGCQSTSYDDLDLSSSIKIFPNPSNGSFQIELNQSLSNDLDVQITDVSGHPVFQKKYTSNELNQAFSIQLLNVFSNGLYLINLKSKDWVATKKILIER